MLSQRLGDSNRGTALKNLILMAVGIKWYLKQRGSIFYYRKIHQATPQTTQAKGSTECVETLPFRWEVGYPIKYTASVFQLQLALDFSLLRCHHCSHYDHLEYQCQKLLT